MRRSRVLAPFDVLAFGDGLAFQSPDYVWTRNGEVVYRGRRPQSCLRCGHVGSEGRLSVHAHGFLEREFITIRHGLFVRVRLWKMRWWCPRCEGTSHSRPPDELPRVKACTLSVVVFLQAVLVFAGLRWTMGVPGQAGGWVCTRTVVRWRERAAAKGSQTEDAIRKAVEKRAGLEPEKSHFGRGLSPPGWLLRRPWSEPGEVTGLWRGIQLLLAACEALRVQCADILAQALRSTCTGPFLL